MGHERDRHSALVDGRNRERDSVDRERALLHAVAEELWRDVEPESGTVALRLDGPGPADAVDVTLDVVATEWLAGTERRLEVDLGSLGELPESGARERLRDRFEDELTVLGGDRGQATAGDGNGVAEARLSRRFRSGDSEPQGLAVAVQVGGDYPPPLAHDPGEHTPRLPLQRLLSVCASCHAFDTVS